MITGRETIRFYLIIFVNNITIITIVHERSEDGARGGRALETKTEFYFFIPNV
jgi:hypothetical protein